MDRMLRFTLSNSNLAGGSAAALVILLYLVGFIHSYWVPLAVMAYVTGFLGLYRAAPEAVPEGLSTQQSLDWLQEQVLPKLPAEAGQILGHILEVVTELMPRLKEMEAVGQVQAENRAKLKQTLNRYLPDVAVSYLKLPALYARTTRVAGNKTPNQLLVEQLLLLEAHIKEIQTNILSQEVDSILANGQFLQDKFSKAFSVTQ